MKNLAKIRLKVLTNLKSEINQAALSQSTWTLVHAMKTTMAKMTLHIMRSLIPKRFGCFMVGAVVVIETPFSMAK